MKTVKKLPTSLILIIILVGMLVLANGADSKAEAAAKVSVKKIVSVNQLTGNKTIRLAKGKKAALKTTVTVTPNKSANKKVTYKSSNKKIATVTSKGVITGKKAGTAKITVRAVKNKKKTATITVKVMKGKVTGIKLNKTSGTLIAGKTVKLKATVKATKGGSKDVIWTTSNKKVATVSKNGSVKAIKAGKAAITATAADGTGKKASYRLTVKKENPVRKPAGKPADTTTPSSVKEASSYGFDITTWSNTSTYKVEKINSRNTDGSNTYNIDFYCNGDEAWIDENVSFEINDVTPKAYKKMFEDMGIVTGKSDMSVESAANNIRMYNYYGGMLIHEKFTPDGPGRCAKTATSGKCITVHTGASTRVIKVTAKSKNNTILDYVYVGTTGYTKDGGHGDYSEYDINLYKSVRTRIEAKIWTNDMSNLEKLQKLADYISATTHYPRTDSTTKTCNPTFWNDWSVDDRELFYNMFSDVKLNRIMDLQGGIVTCQAADILVTAAEQDLGLPYLYDGKNDVNENAGEGIWKGTGSYSSNPGNSSHESLIYQAEDGKRIFIDAQGGYYDGNSAACEQHGCKAKIISLK